MRIRLSDDRRAVLLRAIKPHFAAEFDDPISDFRARPSTTSEASPRWAVSNCPPSAGDGVRDACDVQDELGDIEGEIYEPEPPR